MSGLSDAERGALAYPIGVVVERIVAAREAEARRDERRKVAEEIAQALLGPNRLHWEDREIAARIARAHLDPADAQDDKEGR